MVRLNLSLVQNTLLKGNISIFTISEFRKIFKVKPSAARSFLVRHSKKKSPTLSKIKSGVYIFTLNPPTKFEIANKLYHPSYISFESALSHYNIIPETVYTVTSATTRKTRVFEVQNSLFTYTKIKKKLFFGYVPLKIKGKTLLMAEKEKALLDYLYYLSLRKEPFSERLNLTKIDTQRLGYFAGYYQRNIKKNKTFISSIKKIYQP